MYSYDTHDTDEGPSKSNQLAPVQKKIGEICQHRSDTFIVLRSSMCAYTEYLVDSSTGD
jgi:hypothetical protein